MISVNSAPAEMLKRPLSQEKIPYQESNFRSKLLYYLTPVRRRTMLKNLALVFGDAMTPQEIRSLAQRAYDHFFRSLCENMLMGFASQAWLKAQVEVEGYENILKAAEQKRGVLLLTGHFGNWEFAPVAGMLHFEQFKGRFHVLRRQLVNKLIERVLFRRFYEAGLNVIPKKNSLGQVLGRLSENDVVAFIMDQHAKPGKDGMIVDFFGKKAGTFKSLAVIARATGAPVLPSYCYRKEDGRHVMKFLGALPWIEHPDPDMEISENTQAYNQVLEKIILEHPEQWWWVHRRWKIA